MKILIIEDQPLYADQLEMLCEQLGYEVVDTCEDAFSALDAFHRHQPDLLLSDINLNGEIDGIQLAEKLNTQRVVPVIFVTSLRDEATFNRAQGVLPLAFIIKPFDRLQLQRSIENAVARLAITDASAPAPDFTERDLQLADSFFVKVKNKLEKIVATDIVYIAADGRYCMIHVRSGRKFAVRIPLTELAAKLDEQVFMRSHRSYVFQVALLESVDVGEMVITVAGQEIPLSKGEKEAVLGRLEQL